MVITIRTDGDRRLSMNPASRGSGPLPRPTPPAFTSSGRFTPTLVGLLCLFLTGVAVERGRGNYHRLRSAVLHDGADSGASTAFGGQEPIHLVRTPDHIEGEPEFLSLTLLPGRGLNTLQLTANVPGHGEVELLASPPLARAGEVLSSSGADANGAASATVGGAFMTPWAGRLTGRPSETPGVLQTVWQGQRITFPASAAGSLTSTPGLLLDRGADATHTDVVLGGQTFEATFHPGTFSGNWPSTGSVHIEGTLNAHSLDLSVVVQNTGDAPMPVGIGWLPYLRIASGQREQAILTIPSATRLETDRVSGLPTGGVVSVNGTPLDFSVTHRSALGKRAVDASYVHLVSSVEQVGSAELVDPAFGYGVRLTPVASTIKAFHVVAPADKSWVMLAPQTNYDDPLGAEWTASEPSGIRTLQPGESMQWKVRLDLFAVKPS